MRFSDTEDFSEQKLERIETMIEDLALDTLLSVLYKISEKRKQLPQVICYKSDCPLRDDIPF
ncbi:MAG: hypothetical protein WAM61_05670 [Desulfobacterales bacterium]